MNSKSSDQNSDEQTRDGGAVTVPAGSSLGQQLRRAREQRGTSLREVSDHTRISVRYLEAIEADSYKDLPGGIFNRSFIKAYARHVKFDEQEALEAYMRTMREHGESFDEVATSPTRSRVYMDGGDSRSPFVTAILSAIVAGILILGVYAVLHLYNRTEPPSENQPNASALPATNASSDTVNQPSTPNATQTPETVNTAPAVPASEGLHIQIAARGEPMWIAEQLDKGKRLAGPLKPGEPRTFAPQDRLRLHFRRRMVDNLEVTINGQLAKSPTQAIGDEIEWIITKENYKQYLP